MKLFNQTDKRLVYDEAKPHLVWEPYASLDVTESVAGHLKACGFPVGPHEFVKPEAPADPLEALKAELADAKTKLAKFESTDAVRALADEQKAHGETKEKLGKAVEALKKLKPEGS